MDEISNDIGQRFRCQALMLLRQARDVDGRYPFVITLRHEGGASSTVLWAIDTPSQGEAELALGANLEAHLGESMHIEPSFNLEALVGVDPSARLPDLVSFNSTDD